MSPKQRSRFYFPAWAAAACAHGWESARALIKAQRLDCWASPDLNPLYQQIWDLAEQRAYSRTGVTDPKTDDFRHACHIVAIGRDKSSSDLNNDECDRVVALFKLLVDPDDLAAIMAWTNGSQARRRRILWWINHNCVESYVVAVCREKFGTDEPARLAWEQLQQLHMTLRNRKNARKERVCGVAA